MGKSRSAVANLLRLFQLPPAVQKLVGEGLITLGPRQGAARHPDRSYQEALARRVVAEELTVRDVEELVRERRRARRANSVTPRPQPDARQPKPLRQPGLLELEELLSDQLSTKVRVDMRAKRGKVLIEFANLEDLERIYRVISALDREPAS